MSEYLTDPKGFQRRLAQARKRAGLSQNALSAAGISGAYVHLIERGQRTPSLQVIDQLARHLGVSTHWLLTGEEDKLVAAARVFISHWYEGAEPTEEMIDQLDRLSMPPWYSDWVDWLDRRERVGPVGARPASIPARIPKWVREHQESRQRALERRTRFSK